MMVVLNQADQLTPAERDQCLRDLRRLLIAEGIDGVDVLAVSAVTGYGMDELRRNSPKRSPRRKQRRGVSRPMSAPSAGDWRALQARPRPRQSANRALTG